MLTISGKSLGGKRPLFADFSLALPPGLNGEGGITLRQIIEHVVREEVEAFKKRQTDRGLIRVMTVRQIEEAAERGKIDSGGSEIEPQEVDAGTAVGTAIQAFADGLYFVVVDEQQALDLDQQIFLGTESRITFIRLTLLAGG
jgi:hypothetical protein